MSVLLGIGMLFAPSQFLFAQVVSRPISKNVSDALQYFLSVDSILETYSIKSSSKEYILMNTSFYDTTYFRFDTLRAIFDSEGRIHSNDKERTLFLSNPNEIFRNEHMKWINLIEIENRDTSLYILIDLINFQSKIPTGERAEIYWDVQDQLIKYIKMSKIKTVSLRNLMKPSLVID